MQNFGKDESWMSLCKFYSPVFARSGQEDVRIETKLLSLFSGHTPSRKIMLKIIWTFEQCRWDICGHSVTRLNWPGCNFRYYKAVSQEITSEYARKGRISNLKQQDLQCYLTFHHMHFWKSFIFATQCPDIACETSLCSRLMPCLDNRESRKYFDWPHIIGSEKAAKQQVSWCSFIINVSERSLGLDCCRVCRLRVFCKLSEKCDMRWHPSLWHKMVLLPPSSCSPDTLYQLNLFINIQ